jgi:hypothetical protein
VLDTLLRVCVVLTVIAAPAVLLHFDRRASNGFWLWQRLALRRSGLRGRGVVLSRIDRGTVRVEKRRVIQHYDLVVEVHLEGEQPYRVSMTLWASAHDYTTAEGKNIPVLVDPHDRKRVLYDLSAVIDEHEERRRREELAGEEKRRKLLAEQPPPGDHR